MKDTLLKFIKIFLLIAAVLLAILLIFGAVYLLNWPWWVGIFLLLGLLSLGIGFLFLRKILLRRREQRFVQQVIEQDEAHMKSFAGKEREDLQELQVRWKEAIDTLRRSHLRKFGNPLYVLPWYMVIGESGSGKTTAISSARLSSPFAEFTRTSGISGTRNCDWWFFEQAIILDTAGRYAIPIDEGRDKEEWQRFLNLLIKYRGKEPLNGLIVTLAADKLLGASPQTLEEDGRNIRRRIEELMRVLGTKVPVYIMVTKCDMVQGMAQFCDRLPAKNLDQAMGVIKKDLAGDVTSFLDRALNTIGEHLRHLRILLLHQTPSKTVDPGLLLFPEEFDQLKQGLGIFMDVAFRENPYQETPTLRGLFFSSGRQEGTPYSHFLKELGLIGEKEVLPGTNKGLFLHDFFARILPGERGLLAPTQRALQWQSLTRNLGLVAWVTLGIAVCGLLSFSFVKNLKTLREVSQEFAKPTVLQGEILTDLNTMERFRQAILRVEEENRGWLVPRFGLHESIKVEVGLKEKYCALFQKSFLASFDKQMGGVLARLTDAVPDEAIGPYIAHLVRRIGLLKARLEGQGLETLQKKPQPSYEPPMGAAEKATPAEVKKKFGNLYLYYLVWRSDTAEINKEIALLQSWCKHLLGLKGGQLRWLVVWANGQGLAPVTLGDFWGGNPTPGEAIISPAFTRKGKEMMDTFLKEVESAPPDPLALAKQKDEFEKWYRNACFEAWYQFGMRFPKGLERLRSKQEWQPMAVKMSTDQAPYFEFLNRLTQELDPYSKGEHIPPWLTQVYQLQMAKAPGAAGGLLAKAAEEGKKLIAKGKKGLVKEGVEAVDLPQTVKAYQEYRAALTALAPAATSRTQAFQLASQVFGEDPATSKSPFFAAQAAITRLRAAMPSGKPAEHILWKMIAGPLEFYAYYVRMEAACHLQNQWEQVVLKETQEATDQQATQLLFSQEGPVWKFVKGPAAPFIGWSVQRGHHAKEVLGGAIPLDAGFLSFLRLSAAGKQTVSKTSYSLLIKAFPTTANPQAKLQPQSTRLDLQCGGSAQSLVNFNYPVNKTFQWSPDTCGDVLFQIEVGDVILKKKYSGFQAFPEFLQEFKGGIRTFFVGEFPAEKAALERLGIQFIRVKYEFSGDQPVMGKIAALPRQAPRNIVKCWDQ
ncbi:MAG: type VI secretion system protein ImpL [Deltaproteobacteria bacterium]|nr:type VI secretion system protein ImpL [Deltaproteobacteria bacterium]